MSTVSPANPTGEGRLSQQLSSGVWSHFGARLGLGYLCFLTFLAAFAPFIANNRAIFKISHGVVSMPVFRTMDSFQWEFYLVTMWLLVVIAGWKLFGAKVRWGQLQWFLLASCGVALLSIWNAVQKPINDAAEDRTTVAEVKIMPLIPYSPYETSPDLFMPPTFSAQHYLGTDLSGRDWLARLIHASRYAVTVGIVCEGVALVIGVTLGALSGYYKGWIDIAMMRLVEVVDCVPTLLLILVIVAMLHLRSNLIWIMVIIGATSWTGLARLVRADFLRLTQMPYAEASKALGASDFWIITRHLLPNALGPILVSATFGISSAILIEATLSFLGYGVQPPNPAWGSMLQESEDYLDFAWWMPFGPILMIFLTLLSYNFLSEALRDAVDPKLNIKR